MGAPCRSELAWITAAWLGGLVLTAGAEQSLPSWPALLALVAGMGAAVWGSLPGPPGRSTPAARWLLCGAAAAVGLVTPTRPDVGGLPPSGLARVEGTVVASSAGQAGRARSVLRVERGTRIEDGAELPRGALLSVGPLPLPEGARVKLAARVSPRVPFRNPSPHPSPPPRFALVGRAFVDQPGAVQVLEHPWPAAWLWQARSAVRAALEATLDRRSAAMARALVLGDGDALDPEMTAAVRGSGLLHVLAVSGLHVAILAGLWVAGLHAVLLRTALARRIEAKRLACALGVPLALLYAAFAGGAPSAWRAALTAALAWSLSALGRRPNALATTCAAALALGAASPTEAARPAFLLSIAATVAIVTEAAARERAPAHSLAQWTLDALRTSVRATLATAPIILVCFGSMPLVGVLANLVLLPFGSVLLVQLSALHALAATLTPLGGVTGPPFAICSEAFLAASAAIGSAVPGLAVPPLDRPQALVACALCAVALFARTFRLRLALCALAALVLLGLEVRLRRAEAPLGTLRLTFVDVGQGDATLIDLPDGRAMLVDAGGNPGGGPDPGERVLLPLLAARRRARIDLAVLTHPHPDHYGGLRALLTHVPLSEVWDSGQADAEADLDDSSAEAAALLRALRARGTKVLGPEDLCRHPRYAAAARIEVLWPCPRHDPGLDPNDNSIVIRINFGARSVLLAGDAEAPAERALLARGAALRADVLKVGHHGSRTSTTPAFLAAVSPRIAVVSAGASNRFGHPHAEVIERLHRAKATPIVLSEDGGTEVTTDGRGIWVHTWKGRKLLLPPDKVDADLHVVGMMGP